MEPPMSVEIVVPETPLPEHRETIFRLLDAFNDERSGFPDPVRPLALLLREPGSEVVLGGLWGVSYWQWLFVDLVFVPEALRGQGIGSELLRRAEAIARERNCIGVWLLSFSFQAPAFYRLRGYAEFGHIADYPPGHGCTYLMKRLV
jgi:GNAT superfamily N-acetyltransferase